MGNNQLNPVMGAERIHSIDVIRGLAIFGIFFVNMPSFFSPVLYLNSNTWWNGDLNQWTYWIVDIFAQASFYTLFSFLFGFGMVLFKERAVAKGYSFYPLITRRLIVLLLFGCLHAFFVWHGDILITYAIAGAILLLFHKAKPLTLLIWALVLIFVPNLFLGGMMFLALMFEPELGAVMFNEQLALKSAEIYATGGFWEITIQRFHDWYYVNNASMIFALTVTLLPMFLLGAFIAKKKWFEGREEDLKKVKILWLISLVIGVPMKLLPYYTSKNAATEYLQDTIGGPGTSILYATSIVLIMRLPLWKKLLSPLALVGRLSLSNYLFQSIVCTLLFYGYGFGLYGKVELYIGFLLTIAIFIIQILLSSLWLKKFRFGPFEWVWRTFTYAQKVDIRKKTIR
ncbi:DUF418 domain-containing protein [Bacillus sp. REN16]|uniref:DUF418 domain-containing protein n=1 Tax=Bacillus sp. REN16 TaxID=2887296 RepID=UPI001E3E231B|nr:DUF418 domain-containing protein [Bacillus sp. REN16]MCC3355539.1 DUF418 domain-containing protein [Bacillus sp. REN16]